MSLILDDAIEITRKVYDEEAIAKRVKELGAQITEDFKGEELIVIGVIKAVNLISGYVMRKEFVAVHTVMNKVTGILLFALPLTLSIIDLKYSGAVVCAAATFAAIQEGHLIRTTAGKKEE